jgi:hypothetical protein
MSITVNSQQFGKDLIKIFQLDGQRVSDIKILAPASGPVTAVIEICPNAEQTEQIVKIMAGYKWETAVSNK